MPNCWWHDRGIHPSRRCQHLARAVACASPEASPASSVRRSSAGSARLGRATQWRRVARTCTAQLRGRRGERYRTTARRPRTSGLPARRCQRLPTAPPQPMILGRTGRHICYDDVAKRAIGSGVEHFLHTEGVAGSNPASPTRQVHEVSDSLTSFLRCE